MTKAFTLAALTTILLLGGTPDAPAGDLGTELRESGWDRIIGTWVDPETRGTRHRVTYRWRYKDKVIEVSNRQGGKETTALMGRNPKSGELFHVAADNEGGSSIGKWTFKNGEAALGVLFVTGTGEEGGLQIRHRLEDDDTMLVTVGVPQPVSFKLVRMRKN